MSCYNLMRVVGGLEQGGSSRSREKWLDCGYVLRVELMGFFKGLDMGDEKKKRYERYV